MKSYLLISNYDSKIYIMRFYEEYIIEYSYKTTSIYKKFPDYDYIKAWKNFWVVKEI